MNEPIYSLKRAKNEELLEAYARLMSNDGGRPLYREKCWSLHSSELSAIAFPSSFSLP
jgi:hypothetical protein